MKPQASDDDVSMQIRNLTVTHAYKIVGQSTSASVDSGLWGEVQSRVYSAVDAFDDILTVRVSDEVEL